MAASCLSSGLLGLTRLKAALPVVTRLANYNPRPLRLSVSGPYIPDKLSDKTPDWQKTERYDRKLFGRYGRASGVNPAKLWPCAAQLDALQAEERDWHPPLEVMLANIAAREKLRAEKRAHREKIIAANMAKMPRMVAEWRREKRQVKQKQREEKARRERMLAEARERFGFAVDPRSAKFKEMVAEIEKEEKKKRRLLKKKKSDEEPVPAESSQ